MVGGGRAARRPAGYLVVGRTVDSPGWHVGWVTWRRSARRQEVVDRAGRFVRARGHRPPDLADRPVQPALRVLHAPRRAGLAAQSRAADRRRGGAAGPGAGGGGGAP